MDESLFTTLPVEFIVRKRPPGGTTYLFSWTQEGKKDEWKADGYRWRHGGFKVIRNVARKYFSIYTGPGKWSNVFTRIVYFHSDHPKTVLLKYSGDETKAVDFKHGNATKTTHNYVRTQPSAIKKIKESIRTAPLVYRDPILSGSSDATSVPQIQEEVQNDMKTISQNRIKLTRDALYNLHELAYDTDFVRHITIIPDLVILMYSDETIQVFRETLRISDVPQQLSYDTTLKLGDFYLSTLLFCETEFVSKPAVPLAFMIHEKKTTQAHEILWQDMKSVCPEMQSSKQVLVVTDKEPSITKAIHESFPNMPHFLCWNDILQDCKHWLFSQGLYSTDEIECYIDTIQSLLHSNTEAEYKDALIPLMPTWSRPFSEYFIKNIHSVANKLGFGVLQQYGLTEIKKNQSEALNSVIKQLQEWTGAPIDSMVLSFYKFVQSSLAEVNRSRKSLGYYELKPELQNIYKDYEAQILAAIAPDANVQQMHDGQEHEIDCDGLSNVVIESNRNNHVFAVNDPQVPRVQLFPTATCSCPAVGTCHHILAARKAFGLSESNENAEINLTKPKEKTCNRRDKTRKKSTDIDVEDETIISVESISRVSQHFIFS